MQQLAINNTKTKEIKTKRKGYISTSIAGLLIVTVEWSGQVDRRAQNYQRLGKSEH
jgi:hypothetical protein